MSRFQFEYPLNLPKSNINALSEAQRTALEKFITSNRTHDIMYLNKHLEVRGILRAFFEELTTKLPKDVPAFYREFFGQNINDMRKKVQKHVTEFKREMHKDHSEKLESLSINDVLNNCIPLSKYDPNPKRRCKFEDLKNQTFYLHPGEFYMSESSDEEVQEAFKKRFADKYDE